MTDTRFTVMELSTLPKWAMLKVMALQKSECDMRQRQMGHATGAVFDRAVELVRAMPRSRAADRQATAEEVRLAEAVDGWEQWVIDQKQSGQ